MATGPRPVQKARFGYGFFSQGRCEYMSASDLPYLPPPHFLEELLFRHTMKMAATPVNTGQGQTLGDSGEPK